jgi:hypothetical protein
MFIVVPTDDTDLSSTITMLIIILTINPAGNTHSVVSRHWIVTDYGDPAVIFDLDDPLFIW